MEAQFDDINNIMTQQVLNDHLLWLTRGSVDSTNKGYIGIHGRHAEYSNLTDIDVMGKELIWINENFPRERFTWYIWFESVFLVPDEMLSFLMLRWL